MIRDPAPAGSICIRARQGVGTGGLDLPTTQLALVALAVWTGFVRSAIGFAGAALGLPVLLSGSALLRYRVD